MSCDDRTGAAMTREEAMRDAEKTWIPPLAPIHYVDDLLLESGEGILCIPAEHRPLSAADENEFMAQLTETMRQPCVTPIILSPYDNVNHPKHYKDRVPGIECIEVTKHFPFCEGNAIKYIWRAGLKGDSVEKHVEDLEKAVWYIQQVIRDLKSL